MFTFPITFLWSSILNWLLTGLVSYYGMDSNANDAHGSNNGTETNVTRDTSTKKLGTASWDYNGSNSDIDLNFNVRNYTEISIALWVNPDSFTNNANNDIVNDRAGWGSSTWILMYKRSSNDLAFWISTVDLSWSSSEIIIAQSFVPTWTRTHICLTYDWSNIKIYINWNQEWTLAQTWAISNTTWDITVWSNTALSGRNFDWNIDELWIRNKALTATDVTTLYNDDNWLAYSNFTV